jgi:hypothetical protein
MVRWATGSAASAPPSRAAGAPAAAQNTVLRVEKRLRSVAPDSDYRRRLYGTRMLKAVALSFMPIVIVMFLEILLAELVATVLPVEP